jgi:hypothetical protein
MKAESRQFRYKLDTRYAKKEKAAKFLEFLASPTGFEPG